MITKSFGTESVPKLFVIMGCGWGAGRGAPGLVGGYGGGGAFGGVDFAGLG
jgi:hypothetical protein